MRTAFGKALTSERPLPATKDEGGELTPQEWATSARLMRVNHAGEVAAQALFRGHASTAGSPWARAHMERAAEEENDHLAWCERRVRELDSRPSILNPLWYLGSFAIGALAGQAGDKWSLGFVAETEHQVVRHLDKHLARLPARDTRSRAILAQMRGDELQHATAALAAGAAPLPAPVKTLMGLVSKVMTGTAYWI